MQKQRSSSISASSSKSPNLLRQTLNKIRRATVSNKLDESPASLDGRISITKSTSKITFNESEIADSSKLVSSPSQIIPEDDIETPSVPGTPSTRKTRMFQKFNQIFPDANCTVLSNYSCALERDILWQGRLYLTTSALFFNANIFGKSVTQIISYEEILDIEKSTTAGMFQNAIRIKTRENSFFFASFLKRDLVFEMIYKLWKDQESPARDQVSEKVQLPSEDSIEEPTAPMVPVQRETIAIHNTITLLVFIIITYLTFQMLARSFSLVLNNEEF